MAEHHHMLSYKRICWNSTEKFLKQTAHTQQKRHEAYDKMIASNTELEKQLKHKDTEMESMKKSQEEKIKSLTETLAKQDETSKKRVRELESLNTTLIGQSKRSSRRWNHNMKKK